MFFFRVLLICLQSQLLQEVPTSPAFPFETAPKLDHKGQILYPGNMALYHWIGDSVLTLKVPHGVSNFYFNGSFYWVAQQHSTFFDASGNHLGSFEGLGESWELQTSKHSRPIVSFRLSSDALARNQLYPPLASVVEVQFSSSPIEVKSLFDFAKATPRMNDLGFQFRDLWVVGDEETFYVVDQIEPQVRVYTYTDRERELSQGWRIPDESVTSIPLHLEKYRSMPHTYLDNFKSGLYTMKEGTNLMQDWWDSCPLIVFFGEINDEAHLIGYRIPVEKESRVIGFRLGVQLLGPKPHFGPIAKILEIPEIQTHRDPATVYHIAGVHNGAVIVFFPNIQQTGGMNPTIRRYKLVDGKWKQIES